MAKGKKVFLGIAILCYIGWFFKVNLYEKVLLQDNINIIEDYVEKNTDDILEGNKSLYTAVEVLGMENDKLYLWIIKDNGIKEVSTPLLLRVKTDKNHMNIEDYEYPRENNYEEDIKRLFPESIRCKFNCEFDRFINRLSDKIEEEKDLDNMQ